MIFDLFERTTTSAKVMQQLLYFYKHYAVNEELCEIKTRTYPTQELLAQKEQPLMSVNERLQKMKGRKEVRLF